MTRNNITNAILRNSATTFFLRFFGFIAAYVFTLLVSRTYGAETTGRLAIAMTVILLSSILARAGLDTTLLRLVSQSITKNDQGSARDYHYKSTAIAGITSSLTAVILFSYANDISNIIFKDAYLSIFIKISALSIIPFTLLSLNNESLRAAKKIKSYSFLYYSGLSVFLFSNIFFIAFTEIEKNQTISAISYSGGIILSWIISLYLIKKALYKNNNHKTDCEYTKIFSISIPIMITSFAFYAMQMIDTLFLGFYREESEVGVYNVAIRLSGIGSFALISVNAYIAPKISDFFSNGKSDKLEHLIFFSSKIIFYLSIPTAAILILFSETLMAFFGDEFKIGYSTLIILVAGQLINATCGSVAHILQMTGNEKIFRNIIIFSFGINIALNIALIPTYGMIGAATASLISISTWNLLSVYFIYKKINIISFYIPFFSKSLLFKRDLTPQKNISKFHRKKPNLK